jgi:CRP/FNR family transcriptional regulator, polysaccharide utilization system transcription regulator
VYHQSIFCTLVKNKSVLKKKVKFWKGDHLYAENETSSGVYCLKRGQVEILKKDSTGTGRMIGVARPGEILGASSLMLNTEKYSTSALALRPAEACFITKSDMHTVLKNNPKIAMNLMRMLADKLFDLEPYV